MAMLMLGGAMGACGGVAVAADTTTPPPLIPRAVLFGNPERSAPQLSPDGSMISFTAPLNGVMNVWVAPANDFTKARAITSDTKRGVRQYFWAFTSKHILYLQDEGGDENFRVYSVDVATGTRTDLTPLKGIRAEVQGVSQRFPEHILVGLNDRDPQFHDVHKVNIVTGERSLLFKNEKWASVTTDDDFRVRFVSSFNAAGGTDTFTIDTATGETKPLMSVGMEDTMTTQLMGFDKTGAKAYLMDSRGRNTGALFLKDLATGEQTLIAENPRADVGGLIVHPTTDVVQAVSFEYLREEWTVLDSAIQPDLEALQKVARDKGTQAELAILSRTLDDRTWLVAFLRDNGPTEVHRWDRDSQKATYLFTNRPALENLPLAPMFAKELTARDGKKLVSYLTLPAGSDANNDAKPDAGPVPMVLFVHGGPWARDSWGFNPYHQWLSNRGYAVLSVNFRGSTGFGKDFVNAGNREWAGAMHTDLLDAVDWAVGAGVAKREKVAIMGGSYGGYATLAGLTFTPDVFACGVSIVGPSNIVTLLNSIPPYWAPAVQMFKDRVGDHTTEEGRKFLESRSPLNFVDRITRPLLIGQGANDPRVKQAESDQIVSAMSRGGIPVTYVLFPDEGHGFARPENNMAFNAITENFLAPHLGGRAEPIGDDVRRSTATIPAGREGVPGLLEAITPPSGAEAPAAQPK
jgi:dipeptidyl aminopeptidase/acylaminoacyl peptidase